MAPRLLSSFVGAEPDVAVLYAVLLVVLKAQLTTCTITSG